VAASIRTPLLPGELGGDASYVVMVARASPDVMSSIVA